MKKLCACSNIIDMKVAVIVLNYKTSDLAIQCVKSVKESDFKNIEIILVNNDSENVLKEAALKLSNIIFIQNKENTGYSGGNNIGINKALQDTADYVFILNPDTQIEKETISNLISVMESENADIASPKIYFDNTKIIWYAGGLFDTQNVLGSNIGVDEVENGSFDKIGNTDFATGAAMMVKREVFEKIGLFDERYFLYYEDTDFCYRAKKAGFKIMYVPTAIVYHANAQSTGLGSPMQDYYITRNRMLFAAKFLSFRTKFALFREAVRNINIKARRKALADYLLGKFGKGDI